RVQVGLHVDGAAGIAVVPPGAADVARPFEDHEVINAGLLQPDGHPEAGEPGADDDDVVLLHVGPSPEVMTSGHMTSGHTLSCSRPAGNPRRRWAGKEDPMPTPTWEHLPAARRDAVVAAAEAEFGTHGFSR